MSNDSLDTQAQRFFMAWPNGDIPAMLAAFARSVSHPKEVDPTVEETVDELMELLEDYIEEGIGEMHDHSSDHGWQYDRGHPNWNATMDDLRARLKTLFP